VSPNLDILRALAVMCVFFSHLYKAYLNAQTDLSSHLGMLGIILFFVHTSLVLMQSLERNGVTERSMLKQFYLHRIFRIYPLSITCVLLAYTLGGPWTTGQLLSNLALTMNLTYSEEMVRGLWTLPIEVQMYLALPFLFIWFRDKPTYWLLGLWMVSIPFAAVQPMVIGRLDVLTFVPCFLGGVIAWKLGSRNKISGWVWPLFLAGAISLWFLAGNEKGVFLLRWPFCLAIGLAIPWFQESRIVWLNAAAKLIAKYSYGIYLTHIAAMDFAFRTMSHEPPPVQWIVLMVLVILLPLLAYHLIEHPMIQLGRSLTERRPALNQAVS
jgi:peptidoglycan/LPS O-acetylase OafA/YrhL